MDVQEVLARAWIDCDPNRAGSEPGSGYHPDDIIGPMYKGSAGGKSERLPDTELTGKPRWRWFVPRAEALQAYIEKHGFKIVPNGPA